MQDRQDPLQRAATNDRDLHEVATWEPRSWLDRFSVSVYTVAAAILRAFVMTLAAIILVAQFALGGLGVIVDPVIGLIVVLSIIPALAIFAYIWVADVTTREPLSLLVGTFFLGVLFAMFAAVINAVGIRPFAALAQIGQVVASPAAEAVSFLALALFFFLIVGPVEETVKLLAVRLYAYRSDQFDAVINGAVYGAAAGLGFATIENALYISQVLETGVDGIAAIQPAGEMAAARAIAGPGHVLYSAIAGFYLGLAKFNPQHAGPLVTKGILIAAFFHALYNTLVGPVPEAAALAIEPLTVPLAVFGFVVIYLTVVGFFLYRKVGAYHRAYRSLRGDLHH